MKQTTTIRKHLRTVAVGLVLLACASPDLSGQDRGSIVGRSFDAISGEPIEDLAIRIPDTGLSAVTNSRGTFRLRDVPAAGGIVLRLDHPAYGSRIDTVSVRADETAFLRVSLSKETTPLEPVVVEVMNRETRRERAAGSNRNVITRERIEELSGAYEGLVGVLNQEISAIRVSNRASTPGRTCIEFRGVAKSLRDDPALCNYPLLVVDQSRVNESIMEYMLETLQLEDMNRIEMIPPVEAGVEYGTGSQHGVLVVETQSEEQGVRGSSMPPGLRPPTNYNWAIEPESHPTYRTLGAAALGNAAGLALGLWVGAQCMNYERLHADFFDSRCGGWTTAGSRVAAVGLPILGSTLAARWAGATEVSRGNWKKTAGVATIVLLPGYVLAGSGLGERGSAAETVGKVMISVGVPLATTAADRLFRKIRSRDGGEE